MVGPPPVVVNVRKQVQRYGPDVDTFTKWLALPDSEYVGRSVRYVDGTFNSKWGNYRRADFAGYIQYVLMERPHLLAELEPLGGKELGCWCVDPAKPDTYCHGHAVAALYTDHVINGLTAAELRIKYAAPPPAASALSSDRGRA